jgi:hypothetical protein
MLDDLTVAVRKWGVWHLSEAAAVIFSLPSFAGSSDLAHSISACDDDK